MKTCKIFEETTNKIMKRDNAEYRMHRLRMGSTLDFCITLV